MKSFQNDSATLREYELDFSGSLTLVDEISIECDVQYGNTRTLSSEGEEITSSATVFVTPNSTLNGKTIKQLTQSTWKLLYEEVETSVETIQRIRKPAKDVIDHYELKLR